MSEPLVLPVELLGGPFDGHCTETRVNDLNHDVYVFHDESEVHAYAWSGTTTAGGNRWVLKYLQRVGRKGVESC